MGDIEPEPNLEPVEIGELKISLEYIKLLKQATLKNDFISDKLRAQMHDPPRGILRFTENRNTLLAMRIFSSAPSRILYEQLKGAVEGRSPKIRIPSHYKIKKIIEMSTGVTSIVSSMCVNSCLAFTGPYADCEECPECHEPRYDQIKLKQSKGTKLVPRLRWHTIPIGPVIQALHRSISGARAMRYRRDRTEKLLAEIHQTGSQCAAVLDDYCCSSNYLNFADSGDIKPEDCSTLR